MVEFALVIPVLLLVVAGIIDMGFMLFNRMTVINASREGARAGVTQVANPTAIPSLAQSAALGAATGLNTGWLSSTVTCVAHQQATCDFVSGGQPDPMPGDAVSVTVSYDYHSFFAAIFGTTIPLSASTVMVIE